jgi:hypothetical protein
MRALFWPLALLAACRPDPGAPAYPERAPWDRATSDGFLATPLADGETRLGIGVFYEGETTESVPIDDTTTHFYVYESSFYVEADDDRVEGYASDGVVLRGKPWWGGGVHWDAPRDLSAYDTLHVALRTESLGSWNLGVKGTREARVDVADHGLVADGEWHALEIPLATFAEAGADLRQVTLPLLLVGEGGAEGDTVWIDDLYLRGGAP